MADYSERELWHPSQIVGQNVALRRPRPDDLAGVVRWYRDPEIARLTRYQTRPMTQAEVERFFQVRMLATDALAYTIVELPSGGRSVLRPSRRLMPTTGRCCFTSRSANATRGAAAWERKPRR